MKGYHAVIAAATLLAGCGGSQPPIGAPGAMPHHIAIHQTHPVRRESASGYQVLHSFTRVFDGRFPQAPLSNANGVLYGATFRGGSAQHGVVYRIARNGYEKVLYRFRGGYDAANPVAGLINVNGTLYGTTPYGGLNRYGTVYRISPAGTEKVLYNFAGGPDGAYPMANLVYVKGTLYGTTTRGGNFGCEDNLGCGTVFRVTTRGAEKVLYAFGGDPDGVYPLAGLVNIRGTLYGTTAHGGGGSGCSSEEGEGCGTVYSVSTTGAEKVLYSFSGKPDGFYPTAALLDVNGTLYGTTLDGGANDAGTVYSVSVTGTEKILHSFGYTVDGRLPRAALIAVRSTLYGTTETGGARRLWNRLQHQHCWS